MKIDWKRKLTSRKFWAAVCGFVSMVIMALGKDASVAQTVTGMIMAAASLIAYMIGEGLADSGRGPGEVTSEGGDDFPACGACGEHPCGIRTESASDFLQEESYLNYETNEFNGGE